MADPTYTAGGIASSAARLVEGDRAQQHGDAKEGFERVGRLWGAYLGRDAIAPHDVALMLALLKVGRTGGGRANVDSYIDLAGYAALAGQIKMGENAP